MATPQFGDDDDGDGSGEVMEEETVVGNGSLGSSSPLDWSSTKSMSEQGEYDVYLPGESYPVGIYLIFISEFLKGIKTVQTGGVFFHLY